jgi:cysteinyl-tRNA synthetase
VKDHFFQNLKGILESKISILEYFYIVNNHVNFKNRKMSASTGNVKGCETVLKTPGMEKEVKITFKAARRDILLLSQFIQNGLSNEKGQDVFTATSFQGLRTLEGEILNQAEFSEEFMESWRALIG